MARLSWSRLTFLLFTSVLVGMVWWHHSFAQEQLLAEKREQAQAAQRAIDESARAVADELGAMKNRLADVRKKHQAAAERAREAEGELDELKESTGQAAQAEQEAALAAAKAAEAAAARIDSGASSTGATTGGGGGGSSSSNSAAAASGGDASSALVPSGPAPAGPPPRQVPYEGIPPTAGKFDASEGYDFKDTAVVTLATGNHAARGVIALVQSLRDVGTRAQDIVVLLSRGGNGSPECRNGAWKKAQGRENVHCSGPDTIAEEIISPQYIDTLTKKLGAKIVVVPEIPSTRYTEGIPGGRSTFWGMALNKLRVFNMTQYKKVLWMDGDTMVLKNVDHLFKKPFGTMAFTYACCNPNGPAIPSGGLWVVEPSLEIGTKMWRMMEEGKPKVTNQGDLVLGADGKPEREYWHWGDMQIVRWYFSRWDTKPKREPLWPRIDDMRHGAVAGQRYFPPMREMPDAAFRKKALADRWDGTPLAEGWTGETDENAPLGLNQMGEMAPMWHALDARYDQCVGSCECLPERDMPHDFYSIHFSCLHAASKPQSYDTETALASALIDGALSCTRYYFWDVWYEKFQRAHGRLPEPFSGTMPIWDAAHDEKVRAKKVKHLAR